MDRKRLILWAVIFFALVAVALAATQEASLEDALGGPIQEKDLMIVGIPALVWVLKKTIVPTDPQTGKVVGKWKKLTATLPVVLALAYTWYRSGGIGFRSSVAGVILGATILGGRNWVQKARGK